jgi:DNA-binding CsgD family transcriptional regulator/tetratricopeptide (TPR) repeat protein
VAIPVPPDRRIDEVQLVTTSIPDPPVGMIGSMSRVSSPVFVGRANELTRLSQALELAAAGRPVTRLITGEAGIGKSRLVEEFLNRARAFDALVLEGDCLPLGESGLAYAPFVAALRPLVRSLDAERLDRLIGPGRAELAHLLPDLGPPPQRAKRPPDASLSATTARARLFEIMFGVLHRLAEERPLVLVLEDLHWADASTRDLLRFLVRNARTEPILVVATYRSDELHRRHPLRPLLTELQRLESVEIIELTTFGEAEVAAQLAGIRGSAPDPDLVATVLARSGGNPFFAEELLAAGAAGLVLPRSLRDTLEDRVRQMSADAQRIVRVASVAGARIDHDVLAAVADLQEVRLADGLRELIEHHLLVATSPDQEPGYAFRHALVQEVVYGELLPSERTQLHAAYATAIAGSREPVERSGSATAAQVAHHWLMAHDLERALPAALSAARAAAAGFAFAEAQGLLERALELWPKVGRDALPEGLDRIAIIEEAAEAAAQAGDARRSIDLVRSALAELDPRGDPTRSGVLQHRLAWYLNEAGDWQAGVLAMERAVELIPIDPPTPERARVLADLAHSLMVRGRYGDSLALGEAALAISRAVNAQVAAARALNVIGLDLACRSDFERAIPVLRESHDSAVGLGDPLAIFLTAVGLGWALDESARHAEALDLAQVTRDRVQHLGADARFGGQLASKAARALHDLGRWDEAATLIDETISAGTTHYAIRWLLSNRVRLRIARGQLDQARADLATYEGLGERVIGPDPDMMHLRRAELAIVAGEPAAARGFIRETLDKLAEPDLDSDARLLLLTGLRAEAEEADAARATGAKERLAAAIDSARELAAQLEAHLERVTGLAARPAAVIGADRALAAALAARAVGNADPADWEPAVAGRRQLGRPHELAAVLADAAAAFLDARRRREAEGAISEAHAIATALGAAPLRARLESLARRARIPLEGVDTLDDAADRLGLTRREREVLALVADGRSNRQIGEQLYMAESTAGVHVSNILSKLGVTRRSEAAAVAHRMGLFSPG